MPLNSTLRPSNELKNLNPLQGPTHTLTPSSINTCIQLDDRGQSSVTLKGKDLATCGFQKIPDTPTQAEPSYRKVSLPLQNYVCFSLLTCMLESYGHKCILSYKTLE